jgi:hypothetical protein
MTGSKRTKHELVKEPAEGVSKGPQMLYYERDL